MGGNSRLLFRLLMLIAFSAHLDRSFGYLSSLDDSGIHQSLDHNLPASTLNVLGIAVAESANPTWMYQQNQSPTRTIALEKMQVNQDGQCDHARTINPLSCADNGFLACGGNDPNSQRIFESAARSQSNYKIVPPQLQNPSGLDELINPCLFSQTRSPGFSMHDPTSIIQNESHLGFEAEPKNAQLIDDYQCPAHIEDIGLAYKNPFPINSAYFPSTPTTGKHGRAPSIHPYGYNQELNLGRLEAKYPKLSRKSREENNGELLGEFQDNYHLPSTFDHLIHPQGEFENFAGPSSNQKIGHILNTSHQNGPEVDNSTPNKTPKNSFQAPKCKVQQVLVREKNFLTIFWEL